MAAAVVVLTVGALLALPGASAASGGPDGFGYRFVDSHEDGGPDPGRPTFQQIHNLTGEETLHPESIPLGFSFPFYGERYTTVRVCPQGYLTFSEAPCRNAPEPAGIDDPVGEFDPAEPNGVIAPYWAHSGEPFGEGPHRSIEVGVAYDVDATSLLTPSASTRPFAVRFEGWKSCDILTQVELYPNGTIDFHYAGGTYSVCSPLIGLESPDGMYSIQYPDPAETPRSSDDGNAYYGQLAGESIRWTPPGSLPHPTSLPAWAGPVWPNPPVSDAGTGEG